MLAENVGCTFLRAGATLRTLKNTKKLFFMLIMQLPLLCVADTTCFDLVVTSGKESQHGCATLEETVWPGSARLLFTRKTGGGLATAVGLPEREEVETGAGLTFSTVQPAGNGSQYEPSVRMSEYGSFYELMTIVSALAAAPAEAGLQPGKEQFRIGFLLLHDPVRIVKTTVTEQQQSCEVRLDMCDKTVLTWVLKGAKRNVLHTLSVQRGPHRLEYSAVASGHKAAPLGLLNVAAESL